MIVGAAKTSIVPQGIVDLSGFAARAQPMTGVLDPIHAKALYLSNGNEKFLWLNCDVLTLSHDFVREFRDWAARIAYPERAALGDAHAFCAGCRVVDGLWKM